VSRPNAGGSKGFIMRNTRCQQSVIFFIFLASCLTVLPVSRSAVYHVSVEQGDDSAAGTSWETAVKTIGAALERAGEPGDQIRVAEGTYYEHVLLTPGIQLTGGFEFGGDLPDPGLYVTIIDGNHADRCVTGAENTILQGFTLQNGYSPHGSGVLHSGITMRVSDCIIRNCVAHDGNPSGGGGMHFHFSASLIENCLFENNSVDQHPDDTSMEATGGAVMGWSSSPVFYNCIFRNNSVQETAENKLRLGGAIWFVASYPEIRQCLFENNSADTGGAIGWWNKSRPVVENSIFRNNSAVSLGGGISHIYHENTDAGYPVFIRNCRFEGNSAATGAGMAVLRRNHVIVENCLFVENQAFENGCGMSLDIDSTCDIRYTTFADNISMNSGVDTSCITIDDTSRLVMAHCIVSGNESEYGILMQDGGDPVNQEVRFSNVYGHSRNYSRNFVDRTGWVGNISKSPLFTYFNSEPYCLSEPETGDPLQIQLGRSPCIDAGEYDTEGFPVRHASTRTDLADDTGPADMGFHLYAPGPRYIMDIPEAGAYSVPLDSPVTGRLLDLPETITPDDIMVRLNGTAHPVDFVQIPGGYSLDLNIPGGLIPDTDYQLDITLFTDTGSRHFLTVFSTAAAPEKKVTPIGNTLHLNFPMTQTTFAEGDPLSIYLSVYNPWLNLIQGDIHILFEYAGNIYIHPVWDDTLHPVMIHMSPGDTMDISILSFTVPGNLGALGPFTFYAAATESGTLDFISQIETWQMFFVD
jgi:hypothetical protein